MINQVGVILMLYESLRYEEESLRKVIDVEFELKILECKERDAGMVVQDITAVRAKLVNNRIRSTKTQLLNATEISNKRLKFQNFKFQIEISIQNDTSAH